MTAATSKTVLIVDDTAFVRDRFSHALQVAGHRAITLQSGAELLARVRADRDQIDLIVLDLRLPHAGGVDLVRAIRKIDEGVLPILVFSGTIASADEVRQLAALGVAGYVNEYSAVQHILPSLAPHLFPDNFNRRGSPRVVLGIPVAYRFGNLIRRKPCCPPYLDARIRAERKRSVGFEHRLAALAAMLDDFEVRASRVDADDTVVRRLKDGDLSLVSSLLSLVMLHGGYMPCA